jgi:glycosyltransferase involved in cell wall biosynthesis
VFAGYVPEGEVRAWFELAEAAVLPYRRIEQSGVANLAAAAGTPVLASEVGGITEIGSPRWRFPARDPERLAAVLTDFLAAGERRDGHAHGQDLDAFVAATLAIYEAA